MGVEIHKMAIVENGAELDVGVSVGAFAVVQKGAIVGKDAVIESHSIIKASTRIGHCTEVGHFSVLGGLPQHLGFDPATNSFVKIGNNVRIGEGVTVHRSIYPEGSTSVGDHCFMMGNSHIAHDCKVGNSVVLANGALLGGHVELDGHVFVGGGAALHQFVRVGEGAMIGGLAEVSMDVPPNVTVSGRNLACGLNLIGMKRRGLNSEETSELKKFYKIFLTRSGNLSKRAEEIFNSENSPHTDRGKEFIKFFLSGERGFVRSKTLEEL